MSHVTHRAQPPEAEQEGEPDIGSDPLAASKKKTKPASLIRFPDEETKELVEEAVTREGLSLNKWSVRILVEAAKASRDHGYRSQPVNENPRNPETAIRQGSPTPTTRITPDSFTFNPGGQNVIVRSHSTTDSQPFMDDFEENPLATTVPGTISDLSASAPPDQPAVPASDIPEF